MNKTKKRQGALEKLYMIGIVGILSGEQSELSFAMMADVAEEYGDEYLAKLTSEMIRAQMAERAPSAISVPEDIAIINARLQMAPRGQKLFNTLH